jgi:hypothetical protein
MSALLSKLTAAKSAGRKTIARLHARLNRAGDLPVVLLVDDGVKMGKMG